MEDIKLWIGIAVAAIVSTQACLAQVTVVKIGLIGDSTVAEQSGWGPAFAGHFNDRVKVFNHAVNGATLQSLSKRLDELVALKPDYVLIQFGHNDQKKYDTEVYRQHLRSYVERVQQAGGKPIIVSSVVRRTFDASGKIVANLVKSEKFTFQATLTDYARAAQSVAEEMQVPFIDLYNISIAFHNQIGLEASMAYNFKEGDKTHFNRKGAEAIAALIIPELKRVVPALAAYLKEGGAKSVAPSMEQKAFAEAATGEWQEVFSDTCSGDWKQKWFLDGEVGTIKTGPDGMTLTAGPEFKNDAHHLVLWTKDSFTGDVKIEYDYTRLDREDRCVNILYIQATGSGEGPYAKDITQWNNLRKVPAMSVYFNHMNTYHISYAAFPEGYIRGRRYMPEKSGLKGSDLKPEYYPKGLFATSGKHHITVIKKDRELFIRIENPEQVFYGRIINTDLPPVTEGRIGLRQMFTRSACYKNMRLSIPKQKETSP